MNSDLTACTVDNEQPVPVVQYALCDDACFVPTLQLNPTLLIPAHIYAYDLDMAI